MDVFCPLFCTTNSGGCICPNDKPYFNNGDCLTRDECAAILQPQSFDNCCKSIGGIFTSSVANSRKDAFCIQWTNQTSCYSNHCQWICG